MIHKKSLPKYVDMKKVGGATGGLRSAASSACDFINNMSSAPENLVELTQRSSKSKNNLSVQKPGANVITKSSNNFLATQSQPHTLKSSQLSKAYLKGNNLFNGTNSNSNLVASNPTHRRSNTTSTNNWAPAMNLKSFQDQKTATGMHQRSLANVEDHIMGQAGSIVH